MAAEWYYAKAGEKVGPVTQALLKELADAGELSRTDMVWKQGMTKWVEAGQVTGLFESGTPNAVTGAVPPPLPAAPKSARPRTPELPWPADERNGFSVKQWVGIGVSGFLGFVGMVFVVVSLVQGGQGLCCGPMVFCATGLLLWLTIFNGWMIYGRWMPVDGAGGWVELLKGGTFKREDGMVGTFTLLRNRKFIDIFVAGRLVDSWKILSWGMSSLEVQDRSGMARSFRRGKTLEQRQASPFHRDRTDDLPGTWMPIDGSGKWVQFTKDGAVVFCEGRAGRYTVTGEEPNEVIRVTMADGSTRAYRVMSLSKAQLVIVESSEARTYGRHGQNGLNLVIGVGASVGADRRRSPPWRRHLFRHLELAAHSRELPMPGVQVEGHRGTDQGGDRPEAGSADGHGALRPDAVALPASRLHRDYLQVGLPVQEVRGGVGSRTQGSGSGVAARRHQFPNREQGLAGLTAWCGPGTRSEPKS